MPVVRIEHTVPDFEKWKQAFDNDPADRKGSCVRDYRILRPHEDPNYVIVDLSFIRLMKLKRSYRGWSGFGAGPGKL